MLELQYQCALVTADSGRSEEPRVALPSYDRRSLTPAVVHIGVGGFHRAHQAAYFEELARRGIVDWGVIGVAVHNSDLADALAEQDNLFTVVTRERDDASARIVGVLLDVMVHADDPHAVRRRLADPATRLVTLTITGDGYVIDEETLRSGDTVFATIAQALDDRRRAGLPAFTVLSCDNLPDSAAAARSAALACASAIDPDLGEWIDQRVAFPASMVDRITPAATDKDREWVAKEFAVADLAPVVTEGFAQWVIEDRFCNGRPPLDLAGAQFVDDVGPYKLIKSRMLNGVHSALSYLGCLAGYRRTDEAMNDPVIAGYIERLMAAEIEPLLPTDVAGMTLVEYRRTLLERLRNPAIADPLSRLARRGTTKMAHYLLPSLQDAWARNGRHDLLMVATAAWLRYLRGSDLSGRSIEVEDPCGEVISRAAALPLEAGVRQLIDELDAFAHLRQEPAFAEELIQLVIALDTHGVADVVSDVLAGSAHPVPAGTWS
jgi:mannitol 2-dehydrogenase